MTDSSFSRDRLSTMVDEPGTGSSPQPGGIRLPSFMIDPSRPVGATTTPIAYPPSPPLVPTLPVSPTSPPSYRLYRPSAVGWATFLGSPFAGAILMGINYRRAGNRRASRKAFWIGLLGTAAMIGVLCLLPDGIPTTGIAVAVLIAMIRLASQVQGEMIYQHVAHGGAIESNWKAVGVGLLTALAVAVAIFGVVAVQVFAFAPKPPTSLEIAKGQDILFDGSATEADAKLLGRVLKDAGLFDDSGKERTVLLSKDSKGVKVSVFITAKRWEDADTQDAFRALAKEIADSGLGRPTEVHLVDQNLESHWHERIE